MDLPYNVSNGIERSLADKREYKSVTLANNLQCLLVCDPTADKAAAAMDVNVGHFSDPEEIPGLAHFLEHMLFLGTEKFPDENSYSAFLSANGGSSNAYTSMENTNYYFDVTHPHIHEALDRFAQFFIGPLFNESCVDRELNAVDSEHGKNVQTDMWRMFQLEKSTSSPTHPYHKFATGDSKTLKTIPEANGINVREALIKFHKQYYSANRMKLVVIGRDSLETLEGWVQNMFSSVRNTDAPVPSFEGFPFESEQLQRRTEVVPVKDLRAVELSWPMGPMHAFYDEGAERYVSNLVGHEGPGSVLSILKQKGWANGLGASLSFDNSDFAVFKVNIEMTDMGMGFVDEAISCVMDYLALMRTKGPQEWFWKELAAQWDAEFRFKSDSSPMSFVSSAAGSMHHYPEKHLLTGPRLCRTYNAQNTTKFMEHLDVSNMFMMVAHQSFKDTAELVEPWYKTKYQTSKFTAEQLTRWSYVVDRKTEFSEALHLPTPNEFLAKKFTLFDFESPKIAALPAVVPGVSPGPPSEPTSTAFTKNTSMSRTGKEESVGVCWSEEQDDKRRPPVVIHHSEHMRVWFKQDVTFKRPKVSLSVAVRTPAAYHSPKASNLTELFTELVQDALNEYAYAAELAGLSYGIVHQLRGPVITFAGFEDKMEVLVTKVLTSMLKTKFEEGSFMRYKEAMMKRFNNWEKEQPYNHAIYNGAVLINTPRWHMYDKLQALQALTVDDVNAFVPVLFEKSCLEIFVHGNANPRIALSLAQLVEKELGGVPFAQGAMHPEHAVKLSLSHPTFLVLPGPDSENPNSAVDTMFQVGPRTSRLGALVTLIAHIAQEPCFNMLRTEEQLGYIVFGGARNDNSVLALRFLIQSTKADPLFLDARIEAFLLRFEEVLISMDAETFDSNVNAVLAKYLEKDKTLFGEAARLWSEIEQGHYDFSRALQAAEVLKTLKKQDLIDLFNAHVKVGATERRKMSVGVVSASHAEGVLVEGAKWGTGDPRDLGKTPVGAAVEKYGVPTDACFVNDMMAFVNGAEKHANAQDIAKGSNL